MVFLSKTIFFRLDEYGTGNLNFPRPSPNKKKKKKKRDALAAAAKADGVYTVQNRRWKRKGKPIKKVLDSYTKCAPDLNVMA